MPHRNRLLPSVAEQLPTTPAPGLHTLVYSFVGVCVCVWCCLLLWLCCRMRVEEQGTAPTTPDRATLETFLPVDRSCHDTLQRQEAPAEGRSRGLSVVPPDRTVQMQISPAGPDPHGTTTCVFKLPSSRVHRDLIWHSRMRHMTD